MSSAVSAPMPARLLVTGLEGAVARTVLRRARDGTVGDDVCARLRPDATPPASLETDPPAAQAYSVLCALLSTDVTRDLGLGVATRRATLTDLVVAAADATVAGGRLVVVSSAHVYGATPANPVPLLDDAPTRAVDDGGLVGDLLAVERAVARLRLARPDLRITVLRPAHLVGPGVDTRLTRHFERPRLFVLAGHEPAWQFCHVDDLAAAALCALTRDVGHVATVGCPGWLSQARVERICGRRRRVLPAAVARCPAGRLHAVGGVAPTRAELDYLRYPWVVGSVALRAAGWRPVHDNETCLSALLDELRRHRDGVHRRRDAVVGTAAAAVALAGSAALLRRNRRRN